jgi:hypothetical protein
MGGGQYCSRDGAAPPRRKGAERRLSKGGGPSAVAGLQRRVGALCFYVEAVPFPGQVRRGAAGTDGTFPRPGICKVIVPSVPVLPGRIMLQPAGFLTTIALPPPARRRDAATRRTVFGLGTTPGSRAASLEDAPTRPLWGGPPCLPSGFARSSRRRQTRRSAPLAGAGPADGAYTSTVNVVSLRSTGR